jgi:hypothetical protein
VGTEQPGDLCLRCGPAGSIVKRTELTPWPSWWLAGFRVFRGLPIPLVCGGLRRGRDGDRTSLSGLERGWGGFRAEAPRTPGGRECRRGHLMKWQRDCSESREGTWVMFG